MKTLSHMVDVVEFVRARVTTNGQVSLPAAVRRRWRADSVLVIDRGDYVIVRPVPASPREALGALRGSYAGVGPALDDIRAGERAGEGAGRTSR